MKRKQTRRSISISGELYDVLKVCAEGSNGSQSGLVEEVMRRYLQMEPRSRARALARTKETKRKAEFAEVVHQEKVKADADRLDRIKAVAKNQRDQDSEEAESASGIFTF